MRSPIKSKFIYASEFLNGKLYAHESAFSVQGTKSLLYRIGFSMQLLIISAAETVQIQAHQLQENLIHL